MIVNRLGSGETKLETAISRLLIAGVIVSLVLEVIGVIMYLHTYGSIAISQDAGVYIRGSDFFTFILEELSGKRTQGSGIRFMTAGIIVLILTPYIRLITSVVYFGWEKNTKYVLITLSVLLALTVSLVLH